MAGSRQITEAFNKFILMLIHQLLAKFQPKFLYVPHIKYFNSHLMNVAPVETSDICTIINGMEESSGGWEGIHTK